jgi:outer membrane protein TolC
VVSILWFGLLVGRASADVPAVTLEDAAASARMHASGVEIAEAQRDAAAAKHDSTVDSRLPTLGVSGAVSVYTAPYTANFFTSGGAAPLDCTGGTEQFIDLCHTFQGLLDAFATPIPIHEQVTSALTVRAVEPITGQAYLGAQAKAAALLEQANDEMLAAAVADAELQAKDLWYLALQAERQIEIANAQVTSLETRVQTAQVSFKAGNLTESDRLLAEVALAQAKQSVIQLEALRDTTYARLGAAMGNGGSPVRPASSGEIVSPRAAPPAERLVDMALASRPEVRAARTAADGTAKSADAYGWSRLPQLNAVAAYTNLQGMGPFAETNAAYVGATLDWPVWSWGARNRQLDSFRAQAAQTRAQAEQVETLARVDVQAKVLALQAAGAAYEASGATLTQAEASLHSQEKRQQAGAGAMSDLLDAQSALVRAQSTQANALYDARRAEVALVRAVGTDPWGTGETP